eukprot:TRINITY_DN52066_c0_g1_i1.p1 TRINITY_DN52066_c0_g1~~TRINITY_DN52066_c0_g1_i1.p1  ORF type:complete len:510 (-),score=27.51 TRINITY_DN52066_c0_g1_i1:467-1996(-)
MAVSGRQLQSASLANMFAIGVSGLPYRILIEHPLHGFGSPFCFSEEVPQTFAECCGRGDEDEAVKQRCFSPPYTEDACCRTSRSPWFWTGRKTQSILDYFEVIVNGSSDRPWVGQLGIADCFDAGNEKYLHQFSDSLDGHGQVAVPGDEEKCVKSGGNMFFVETKYDISKIHTQNNHRSRRVQPDFRMCAPAACNGSHVASNLAPRYLSGSLKNSRASTFLRIVFVSARQFAGIPPESLTQLVGPVGEEGIPAARSIDVAAYHRMFWVCGACNLRRYGAERDSGYLTCELQADNLPSQIYSFGIEYADTWGEALARATGGTLYQYDCFHDAPKCSDGLKCVFFKECVGGTPFLAEGGADFRSLDSLVQKGKELDSIIKLDIESWEWGVFADPSVKTVLHRFQQIIIEFHDSFLKGLMDEARLSIRASALTNLLQLFVVVHVHINNNCQWPIGSCLEVTFANRRLVTPHTCRLPTPHRLDTSTTEKRRDVKVTDFFRELTEHVLAGREPY